MVDCDIAQDCFINGPMFNYGKEGIHESCVVDPMIVLGEVCILIRDYLLNGNSIRGEFNKGRKCRSGLCVTRKDGN